MINSNGTVKAATAQWDLAQIKGAVRLKHIVFSRNAQRDYTNLGMEQKNAIDCILSLQDSDFHACYKYPDGTIHDSYEVDFMWHDENEECERNDRIFIKLCVTEVIVVDIVRFHLPGKI
jgi:hypothetical protein